MSRPLRVLVVEDSEDDAQLILRELRRGGFEPDFERVETAEAMRAALEDRKWDIVIADYRMPQFSAPAALEQLNASGIDVPFIIVSGTIGEETAVAALKAGAHDFLIKSKLARLIPAIERELREAEMRRERRQLEKQLLLAQKMEAIGQLAGGVAHDFNNLLTVIISYSELLLQRLAPGEPLRAQVEEIQKAGDRAAALTRQLLAFSRRQVLAPQVLDLNAVLENIHKMLERLIGEDINLVSACARGLGRVKADPSQIEQVIMNLAANARDAMPKGGKLTIETADVELGEDYARNHAAFQPGRYVMLAISDTGMGMDKETQTHIFEPFFTTKELGKGTGLGLATVYGIVKQSGGCIWVYSEPGRGSTFKIYFPRLDAQVESSRPGLELPVVLSQGTERILWVEDEPAVRALVQEILQSRGYTLLVAKHGEEALRLAEEHRGQIDLLLTDVVMPGMTGPDLLQRLKQTNPAMKVLYVSGYADTARIHHGMLNSQDPFLQKPFTPQSLAHKIREVLGQS